MTTLKQARIAEYARKLGPIFKEMGVPARQAARLAQETATKVDRYAHPYVPRTTLIQDEFNTTGRIVITISNGKDVDPVEVLKDFLSRGKGYPRFERWSVEKTSSLIGMEQRWECTVTQPAAAEPEPRAKVPKHPVVDTGDVTPEQALAILKRLREKGIIP